MKTILCTVFLALSASLSANPMPMRSAPVRLTGETVEAHVLAGVAVVSGVYKFDEWYTRDRKVMYIPIFVGGDETPIVALARAKFEVEVGGEKFDSIAPCEAPAHFDVPKNCPKIEWFVVDIDDQVETLDPAAPSGLVRITYEQPLIDGVFYYIPVIVGQRSGSQNERAWNYQMHASAPSHALRVISEGTDYERLAGGIVVYLQHRGIVALK